MSSQAWRSESFADELPDAAPRSAPSPAAPSPAAPPAAPPAAAQDEAAPAQNGTPVSAPAPEPDGPTQKMDTDK
tara:strand:- start:5551 stop:5772 length:222 start_codon:yes stop_codon:yes gene_type:complete